MRLFFAFMLCCLTHAAQADWWRTPEQQASDAFQADDIEKLSDIAPDAQWQAIASHEKAEYETAASQFAELASQSLLEGDVQGANRALYNQGLSEIYTGAYEQALATLEQVVQSDPQHEDAAHNLDIVRQLIEQQQQQEQQQQSGEQSGDDSTDQQDSDQQPDQQSEQQSEQQNGDSEESNESQSDSAEQDSQSSETEEAASKEQQEKDAQAARDALDAQSQQEQESDENSTQDRAEVAIETMSESDQATEQWLRRIPDDPAGLLRRKLEQSHQTEFPEVTNAINPW